MLASVASDSESTRTRLSVVYCYGDQ